MPHRPTRLGIIALLAFLCVPLATPANAQWADLVIFGDSLSDVGNVRQRSTDLTFGLFPQPDDRYDRGRFSNGPVWVETLANQLALDPPTRSYRANGKNYAYGGATTGTGSSNLSIVRNVGWQVGEYLDREATIPSPQTLIVLWAGGNNFLDGSPDTQRPADDLISHLQRLYDAGARNFLVPNLPPLGETPRFLNSPTQRQQRNTLASDHNRNLALGLTTFSASRDANVFQLDIESLFFDLLNDPAAQGLRDTTSQAIDAPNLDPSEFLYWDDVHPTTTAHTLIADAAIALLTGNGPGDFDRSGTVEQADLDLVLSNWGQPRTFTPSSLLPFQTTTIDQEELDRVLANWGRTTTPSLQTTHVPEPTAAAILLTLLAVGRQSHRRGCIPRKAMRH